MGRGTLYAPGVPAPRIHTVILNGQDQRAMVSFWSAFLEVDVQDADDDASIVWLRPSVKGGMNLGIQRVDHPLQPVTQVHLDIAVDDLDAATARITDLGGGLHTINRLASGFEWRVVHDPAGHQFCIFRD